MIEEQALRYLDLKEIVDGLEGEMQDLRVAIEKEVVDLEVVGLSTETDWHYPNVTVTRIKPRVTKTLQRKELVKLGISGALLDAATKVTTGDPSLRITRPKEGKNAHA